MIQWRPTQWLKTVPSTQQWIQAQTPLLLDTIVAAEYQSSGLGTRGKSWKSKPGDLTFSFGFLAEKMNVSELLLSVSLAICDALNDPDVVIKPPNDLYLNDQKLGGILIEKKRSNNQTVTWVGIGVNFTEKTDVHLQTSFLSAGISLNAYLDRFKSAFNQRLQQSHEKRFKDYHEKIPWEKLTWYHNDEVISPVILTPELTVSWGSHSIPMGHVVIVYKR